MNNKVMISDLIYDANIVISETIKGKTYYWRAILAPGVENSDGIISTVILRKGKKLTMKEVMDGDVE